MAHRSTLAAAVLLAVATTAWAQSHLPSPQPLSRQPQASLSTALHADVLRALSFGQAQSLADLLYLQAVAVWGQRTSTSQRYEELAPLLQRVVALDAYYEAAYLLAGTALTMQGMDQEAGMALLARGAQLCPHNWRLLFLYGFNTFDLQHDSATAARALAQAALLPEAPEHLSMLAASMSAQSHTFETAIAMLKTLAQETDDPDALERYHQRIVELERQAQAQKAREPR